MKTKSILTTIISFLILNFNFGQIGIQDNWVNEDLLEMKIENQKDELIISTNSRYWSGSIKNKQLQLVNSETNWKYNFSYEIIENDTLVLTPKNDPTCLSWGKQKFVTRNTLEKELKNISKFSMKYYPSSWCEGCKEVTIEIKEDGFFTIKHESINEGFDIHQGRLNKYGIQKFKNLAKQSLVHKYPEYDLSNRFVAVDSQYFYFSIHVNGQIKTSGFSGTPPNSQELIEFLLNISEAAELDKIENYKFEIK